MSTGLPGGHFFPFAGALGLFLGIKRWADSSRQDPIVLDDDSNIGVRGASQFNCLPL